MRHYEQKLRYGKIFKRTIKDKNKIITLGNTCYMELCNQKLEKVAITIFDLDDLNRVKKFKWGLSDIGLYEKKGYVSAIDKKTKKKVRLHRFILKVDDQSKIIDHVNMDKLDNRKKNLREVTSLQNSTNNNAKNYYYIKNNGKWRVRMKINKKDKSFGCFCTEKEASQKAYEMRKQRYLEVFGETKTFIN